MKYINVEWYPEAIRHVRACRFSVSARYFSPPVLKLSVITESVLKLEFPNLSLDIHSINDGSSDTAVCIRSKVQYGSFAI